MKSEYIEKLAALCGYAAHRMNNELQEHERILGGYGVDFKISDSDSRITMNAYWAKETIASAAEYDPEKDDPTLQFLHFMPLLEDCQNEAEVDAAVAKVAGRAIAAKSLLAPISPAS